MTFKEIESLKSTIVNLIRSGCKMQVPAYGVSGRLIGAGFKPYWTNSDDSKIEKIELNFINDYGRVVPFNFLNIIGYSVASKDAHELEDSKNISLDLHVYSPGKVRDTEHFDKVRLNLSIDSLHNK